MGASNVQNFGGLINYSTDEQVIGTWIDGKPLYQVVLTKTVTVNNQTDVSFDISALNIDEFIVICGSERKDSDGLWERNNYGYMKSKTEFITRQTWSSNTIPITFRIVLQYTKTTD